MTLAELIVAIKFQVTGGGQLPTIQKDLDDVAKRAGKLALGLDIITAGLGFMMDHALNAAVGLNKFAQSTGLSTTELQQWQHSAALYNVSGEEIAATAKKLQEVVPGLMLAGGAAAQPWFLLGVDPAKKWSETLLKLSKDLKGLSPNELATKRVLFHNAGFSDDLIQFLRQYDPVRDSLKEQYVLTGLAQAKLMNLNRDWQNLKDVGLRVSDIFSSILAPAFDKALGYLGKLVDKLAEFAKWLNSGKPGADAMREAIQGLAVGVVTLAAAFTAFAAGSKLAAAGAGFLNSSLVTLGATAAALLVTVNAIVEGYRYIQNLRGGNDETERSILANRNFRPRQQYTPSALGGGGPLNIPTLKELLGNPAPSPLASSRSLSLNIAKIQVDGSRDPNATGRAVVDQLSRMLTYTGSNAPVPNF